MAICEHCGGLGKVFFGVEQMIDCSTCGGTGIGLVEVDEVWVVSADDELQPVDPGYEYGFSTHSPENEPEYHDPYYDDEWDDEPDSFDSALQDCGIMGNGECAFGGSEFCDWHCPIRGIDLLDDDSDTLPIEAINESEL
jgi:hypothetical protein